MSLQLPRRGAGKRGIARLAALPVVLAGILMLAGCSSKTTGEWKRVAMPEPATEQGHTTLALWQGAWIAAMITGLVVWGLIFFVVVKYRRRSDDEIPVQTRYNLPLEIFYTIAPVIMVIVFFVHTVRAQDVALDDTVKPDNIVEVTAQQWSWTFNNGVGQLNLAANDDNADDEYPYSEYVSEVGTASYIPTLVLPVGETTRFNLHSPDVIHDFGIPGFLMKMDVIPGRVNSFQLKPEKIGTYDGKCYELCGVYHSRMLFKVQVVSQADYAAYLAQRSTERDSDGNLIYLHDMPLLGGENATTQAGLETEGEHE